MTKRKIHVTIDSREPALVSAEFAAHPDVESWETRELPIGDIIAGNVVIERKTPSDLVGSITDNRLFAQARELSKEDQAYVLLEGTLEDFENLSHTELPPSAVRGSIASVMVRTGVPVVACGNRIDLADMAVRLGRKSVEEESVAFNQDGFDTGGDVSPTVQMYAAIPGVGPKRAKALYERFPAPVLLSEATQEEIQGVGGFGEKTAEDVWRALHGELD